MEYCFNIMWHNCLDSTNKQAHRLLNETSMTDILSVIAAREQTAGRGQGTHTWTSAPGENLTFSMILNFEPAQVAWRFAGVQLRDGLEAVKQQIINTLICPVICDFLSAEGVQAHVKQPNDIWVGNKKICGILVENILRGSHVRYSIVGVGLNLNQTDFPAELPNPVSLTQLTGKKYKPENVLSELVGLFCKKNMESSFSDSFDGK